ncbi:MAG TPA: hypothetical protein VN796_08015 [Acidimicrobiales bacterium]|nr:hypothetical protein [Acidimicrobiales bacterium]
MHDQGSDTSPGPHDGGAEWQVRVVDTVEDIVSAVHDRVIRPLLLVARAIVFGLIVATMVLVVGVMFSVVVIRILDVYAFRGRVWASDATVGGLLTAAGLLLWARRSRRGAGAP